ncbi:MAG: SDR family oxidoreductase [Actinomycetota bacterium]|nr:SDR family oxidoreductase [Actinomycetota bacterium]
MDQRTNGSDHGDGNGHNAETSVVKEMEFATEERVRDVLVIGGAGFVGSVLVRELIEHGYRVTVMDALMYGDESIRDLYGRPDFDVVKGDLRSVESIVRSVKSTDAVIHLGGLVGDPACNLDEKLTQDINLHATRTIAEAARGLGVRRMIFASSCSVYGVGAGTVDEDSPLHPVSAYAQTKVDSEKLLLSLNNDEFSPVILRFGTFYGLSPRPRFDLVVNMLVAKALAESEISIFGGQQVRPFVHVRDGARVISQCLRAPLSAVKGQVFNVGSDSENHSLAEVAEMVRAMVEGTRVNYEEAAAAEADYRVSFAKIRDRLGFENSITLADGLLELKEALESGTIAHYLDQKYSNVKALASGDAGRLLGYRVEAPDATGAA